MVAERHSDIAIIGAGPVALFSVFQLGLFGFKCRLFDSMDRAGGQCTALYADKPIFDIPAFPEIMSDELVDRLLKQIEPYRPDFEFNQLISGITVDEQGVQLTTAAAVTFNAKALVIASGLGALTSAGQIVRPDPLATTGAMAAVERFGNAIVVSSETFRTSQPKIYAIGDVCHYPGKLKLIVSGFHEVALMTQAIRRELQQAR
ncbi:NAD(P)/FAD-dependent oxidoreductase [Ochrobactrum sp. MYb15]|uniref:NAD(P)/FAD-dependent oxidoreductase n=1 Tax=Brucella TaxID=234 RepID=UPI0001C8785B|nr:NAD(P)/FAD-dependent oxidoreductase [Brucella rhizosphaerae]PQZ51935.1 NAD(P)/FAD-dependent oxidoreductase [Ochrobactrum sp. MYb19]PRA56548.1 NAD(P)/FAD-dependent oxidoreductase [Ochrobactrum sp. MYb68]PRA62625.1 NAD(P)/FAD-dependent oxidoreductase [Ochrobactrum sp. MYb18]PRA76721.1 NAD(P)/FAD-dependent oxidoreductase [Brucella thiophenivorans]PRA93646.1 NAD(P)/FAD-dependent oxidoreductase [Ochrobactrum sp. MYb14]PRA98728.1 NAD(P)/FAD-dependent oxidoreductase [Ochrobactrum sp. MYb15]